MSKVWFITGSSRGLGRSIVEAAVAAGDRLVATARKPQQLADLAARHGERLLPVTLDVADNEQVLQEVQTAHAHFGRIG